MLYLIGVNHAVQFDRSDDSKIVQLLMNLLKTAFVEQEAGPNKAKKVLSVGCGA
jgi:hypothetical protein